MAIYRYDGTFDGILYVVKMLLEKQITPEGIIREEQQEASLFSEIIFVETNLEEAKAFGEYIKETLGKWPLAYIYYGNLAEEENVGLWVYEYVKFGLEKGGRNLNRFMAREEVARVQKLRDKVLREKHRLLGLVRFRKLLSGIYYSEISPDHRVLSLLGSHFSARLPNERWMIHDVKREWALLGQDHQYQLLPLGRDEFSVESDDWIEDLWRQYYGHVAIVERRNARAQKNFMPRRYWEYLTENPGKAEEIQQSNREKYKQKKEPL